MPKKVKQPWPTKDAMAQVYDKHLWGGKCFDFYSGEGSHHPEITGPYIEQVILFLKSFNKPITVCDLGCGDFNIGKQLVKHTKTYIAIDVVEPLINRNKHLFNAKNLEFYCLDIAKDTLPAADCIILRQVLQHLSNAEILSILKKLEAYQYIILTEHIPSGNFTPNKDIISGQGTRLKQNSGVDIFNAPFNFKVKSKKQLANTVLKDGKGQIATTLFTVF